MTKRRPFNPDDAAGAPRAEPPAADRPMTISELAARIDRALAAGVPSPVRVIGEVSNFRRQTHLYFNLKDPDADDADRHGAVVSCVMFAAAAKGLGFAPEDGAKVIAAGRIAFFARQGRTQLYVESMEPVGLGTLEARFRALVAELRGLGYFDAERKRPLPAFPRRVAIVTSRTGAALRDVLDTMRRRCPAVDAVVIDVRVQGEEAAPSIVRALDFISREHARLGIDAAVLTRGGGSIEDLWAFNERAVADAVLRCAIPVVAAIGHETDTTIAELVADLRGATPTQAAMAVTPDRAALGEELDHRRAMLMNALRRRLERERQRVALAARHALFADPGALIREASRRAELLAHRLHAAGREALARRRLALERAAARLSRGRPEALHAARRAAVLELDRRLRRAWRLAAERRRAWLDALERELTIAGPASVLARGYSVTTTPGGEVVRSVSQATPGAAIVTRVADGRFESVVRAEGVGPSAPPSAPVAPVVPFPRRARRRDGAPSRRTDDQQMGLF